MGRRCVEARVWEQGVGETLACGSGACAITVAARLHGYVGEEAEIRLPGGRLEVEWDEGREAFLSGPGRDRLRWRVAGSRSTCSRHWSHRVMKAALGNIAHIEEGGDVMKVARRVENLPPYLFVEISRKIAEKRARGEEVISFGIGDPDIPTPPHVLNRLIEASRDPVNHRYPESEGLPELRRAVAAVVLEAIRRLPRS